MKKMDSKNSPRVVIFGFSANPPGNHHLAIVQELLETFRRVIVMPRGTDSNKPSTAITTPAQRKEMVKLVFSNLPNTEIDFFDLDQKNFTPTWMIDQKYKTRFPDLEIWHVVGGDLIKGGASGNSEIQEKWRKGKEIWENLNWAVIDHLNHPINLNNLPPHNMLIEIDKLNGRSTIIRNKVATNQPIGDLVSPEIEEYITKNGLYE